MKNKITPLDLTRLHENAIRAYKDDAPGDLTQDQFRAQCFLKASLTALGISDTIEFPYRKNLESVDE